MARPKAGFSDWADLTRKHKKATIVPIANLIRMLREQLSDVKDLRLCEECYKHITANTVSLKFGKLILKS